MCLQYKPFENTVEEGEIARDKQFLLSHSVFYPIEELFFHFHQIWNCRLQTLSVWKSLKLLFEKDDKLNVAKMTISLFDRIENTVGKRENAGYHYFFPFPVFFKAFSSRVVNSQDCVVKFTHGRKWRRCRLPVRRGEYAGNRSEGEKMPVTSIFSFTTQSRTCFAIQSSLYLLSVLSKLLSANTFNLGYLTSISSFSHNASKTN